MIRRRGGVTEMALLRRVSKGIVGFDVGVLGMLSRQRRCFL